jgi:aminodeoxyfutalosine synthase
MGSNATMPIDDALAARAVRGERLSREDLVHLSAVGDILALGVVADEARQARSGPRATYLRVFQVDTAVPLTAPLDVPGGAGEVRLTGLPRSLPEAVAAVRAARAAAGARHVSAFSLADLVARAVEGWGDLGDVAAALKEAGLDAVAEAPADRILDLAAGVRPMLEAGVLVPRITVDAPVPLAVRVDLLLRIRDLQDATGALRVCAPLPRHVPDAVPTTGYDDVRMVALARLALETVPSIQVDWALYGPKLAQVALTFGADDLDSVSAVDDDTQGRRRGAVEEIRRNIEAAGLQPAERDGRFGRLDG